jgi:hypothetical protein
MKHTDLRIECSKIGRTTESNDDLEYCSPCNIFIYFFVQIVDDLVIGNTRQRSGDCFMHRMYLQK